MASPRSRRHAEVSGGGLRFQNIVSGGRARERTTASQSGQHWHIQIYTWVSIPNLYDLPHVY